MPAVDTTAPKRVRATAALFLCGCPYAASVRAHERALHIVGPNPVLEAVHRDVHDLQDIGVLFLGKRGLGMTPRLQEEESLQSIAHAPIVGTWSDRKRDQSATWRRQRLLVAAIDVDVNVAPAADHALRFGL